LGRHAALLRGPSGSGKSDLALRFLFLARRGPVAQEAPSLVADDQVMVKREEGRIIADAPGSILGQMEVRGIGMVGIRPVAGAELVLVVDLVHAAEMERLPEAGATADVLGVKLPLVRLAPFEYSAPIKLALALARARRT
jgi:serine kinase of HPr protein (carbohydrate metabolism regulator)